MTAPELGWDGHPADEQEPPPDFLEVLDGGPADAAPEKPTIQIRAGHLSDMIQATIRALGEGDHNLYQRSGQLVRIVREPERREPYELDQRQGMSILTRPGTPRLTDAAPILLEQADVAARWERFVPPRSKKEDAQGSWVAANPDPIVINQIAKRQDWPGIRPIRGLLETPCLAPSGRIIQAPGYDEETAHVLLPSCGIGSLIEVPTQANARAALKYLWTEIACDFPFRGIGEPARDGAVDMDPKREIQFARALECPDAFVGIASLLTVFARLAIRGAIPGGLFEAAGQGSGKSLQIHTIAMIATSRPAGVATFPTRDGKVNEEELEKILAGYALASARIVAFDNIRGLLAGGTLEKALTSPENIDLRVLGSNMQKSLPWMACLLFSGNNMAMSDDVAQRVMISRLESPRENPRSRPSSTFRHPDLLDAIKAQRPRLVRACLVILRALFAARDQGLDVPDTGSRGSFEAWAKIVPPAIRYAGGPNVIAAFPEEGRGGDEEGEAHATLLRWWQPAWNGQRASVILEMIFRGEKAEREGGAPDGLSEARAAVRTLTKTREGQHPSVQVFGIRLFSLRGKIRDGHRIDATKDKALNAQVYSVAEVK